MSETPGPASRETVPFTYLCHRVPETPEVDGELSHEPWAGADRSPRFVDMVTGAPALFDTRAAMLWDDKSLYVAFWMTEADVWSTHQERTGLIWQDNGVEVLIAGPGATYELSVNPVGATLEMFYIWKDAYRRGGRYDVPEFDLAVHRPMVFGGDGGIPHVRGMRWGFFHWHFPGLRLGIQVDGTLDRRDDVDQGWTVALAFPWSGMKTLAPAGGLPPKVGDTWRICLARRQIIDQNTAPRTAVWSWDRMGGVNELFAPEQYLRVRLSATAAPREAGG